MTRSKVWVMGTLAAALVMTGCQSKNNTVSTEAPSVKIKVAEAQLSEVDLSGVFTATVEAEVSNNISPQSPGRIKRIYAEVGDHVSQGQKLAEMDDVNLEQTRLQMENNKVEFDRVDELYKVGGISKSEWDNKKLTYELSRASYANLLENTCLRSPVTGMVTKRNYDNGDMWSNGDPIFVVEQIRPVKLMVNVSESLFTQVKKGMEVGVKLDVYGEEEFKGTVKLVHPSIDPSTRTFPVEINIPNKDERVRPGMFARVTFSFGTIERVMVSDRAVIKQSGSADRYVYVCKNGEAAFRKVVVGRQMGDKYEVLEGLADGETVAITAQNRLNDGIKVEIVK